MPYCAMVTARPLLPSEGDSPMLCTWNICMTEPPPCPNPWYLALIALLLPGRFNVESGITEIAAAILPRPLGLFWVRVRSVTQLEGAYGASPTSSEPVICL